MINLEYFKDVHPKWEVIQGLEREEARATLELLELAVFLDEQLTRDEVEVLTEEWLELPHVEPPPDATGLFDKMLDTHDRIKKMEEDPKVFESFIDRIAGTIQGDDARYAVFRLVAIVASSDGFDERELDFCYALGAKFGFELDTLEDLLRSVWETHEEAVDIDAGRDHDIPPVTRDERGPQSKRRSLKPHPNPFSTRV